MASILVRALLPPYCLTARPLGSGCVAEPRAPSLEQLLEQAQAGDREAFAQLRGVYARGILRFVTKFVRGDVEAARDIVQECFLATWNNLATMKSAGHMRSWLYRVARFRSIDHLRRRSPNGRPMTSLEVSAARGHEIPDPDADPLRRIMVKEPGNPWLPALRRAIARLPHHHVAVVRLHYLRGLPTREVGTLLSLNNTTVKMRLLRARQLLHKLVLEEMGERGGPSPR